MTSLQEKLLPLREIWKAFHVRRAWLFGSRAGGDARELSDWDFLVEFARPPGFDDFLELRERLQSRLQGKVDLLSRSACKPRFLQAIANQLIDVT